MAHNDVEYYNNIEKLFEDNSITYGEIEKLLNMIKDALNMLINDLSDTTWYFGKEGSEKFTYICKIIKENKKIHIKKLKKI